MSKTPSFPFYPSDFLGGTSYMTSEEVGGYIRLLCYQWDKGFIPSDIKKLKIITGCQRNAIAVILDKFEPTNNGNSLNKKLEIVRNKKIEYSEQQKALAELRWLKERDKQNANAMPSHNQANAEEVCQSDASLILNSNIPKGNITKKGKKVKNFSQLNEKGEKHKIQEWIEKEKLESVLKLSHQLSFLDCEKIIKEFGQSEKGKQEIKDLFWEMENWKPLIVKYNYVNLAFRKFMKNYLERKSNQQNKPDTKEYIL